MQKCQRIAASGSFVSDFLLVSSELTLKIIGVVDAEVLNPNLRFLKRLNLLLLNQLFGPKRNRLLVDFCKAARWHCHRLISQRGKQSWLLGICRNELITLVHDLEKVHARSPLGLNRRVRRQHHARSAHELCPEIQTKHRFAGARRRDDVEASLPGLQLLFRDLYDSLLRRP